jgi:hypothetical protein
MLIRHPVTLSVRGLESILSGCLAENGARTMDAIGISPRSCANSATAVLVAPTRSVYSPAKPAGWIAIFPMVALSTGPLIKVIIALAFRTDGPPLQRWSCAS